MRLFLLTVGCTGAREVPLAPLTPWASLGFWGLRKPWEPSEAFCSLGSSVRLGGLVPLAPHSPSPPGPLEPAWGFRKPSAALGLRSDSGALFLLLPHSPCPFLLLLAPLASLGPWGLRKPWEPLAALGLQSDSGALFSLLPPPPYSPSPLIPCKPPWGLRKLSAALGRQSDSGALFPFLPLTPPCSPLAPWASLGPWNLPEASGSLGSLRKPSTALGLHSNSGALFPLLLLTPWASLGPSLGPKEALGVFKNLWQPWVFSETWGGGLVLLAPPHPPRPPCSPCLKRGGVDPKTCFGHQHPCWGKGANWGGGVRERGPRPEGTSHLVKLSLPDIWLWYHQVPIFRMSNYGYVHFEVDLYEHAHKGALILPLLGWVRAWYLLLDALWTVNLLELVVLLLGSGVGSNFWFEPSLNNLAQDWRFQWSPKNNSRAKTQFL